MVAQPTEDFVEVEESEKQEDVEMTSGRSFERTLRAVQ
jgi:hypothetical protein